MRATTANDNNPNRLRAQSIPVAGTIGAGGVVTWFEVGRWVIDGPAGAGIEWARRDGALVDLGAGRGRDQS